MTGKEFKKFVESPVLADGAWGTELFKSGLPLGQAPEVWNLEHPEKVQSLAAAYAAAGSRIILTNSFGGTPFRLASRGLAARSFEINLKAAQLTKGAGGGDYLTAGDMGPTGKKLWAGEISCKEVEEAYKQQAMALKAGGADLLLLETFSDLQEGAAALKGALAGADGLAVACCFSYERREDGTYRTFRGHRPFEVIPVLEELGASAVGANCGGGMEQYEGLAREILSLTSLPVWIKASPGIPALVQGRWVYPLGPEEYASYVPALLEAGVSVIGGCCGTGPEYIEVLYHKKQLYEGGRFPSSGRV